MQYNIDLNVDVGEGFNNESQLFPFISSCNIACGGHAGNQISMQNVVQLAKQFGVKIGAHPSFPDIENFGRKPIKMSQEDLFDSMSQQIKSLNEIVESKKMTLNHIKPHGALYNLSVVDKNIATTIIKVIKNLNESIKLYVPYNSVIEKLAIQNKIPIVYEAFADRNYNDDLSLVSRSDCRALITDSKIMLAHVMNMVVNGKVKTILGIEKTIIAETFCLHSDTINAVKLVKELRNNLEQNNIVVR